MSNLADALREKISILEDEETELEDALARVKDKKEVLQGLLEEEDGKPAKPAKRGRGRPRGSRNKKKEKAPEAVEEVGSEEADSIQAEASTMEGTPPEIAERLSKKRFHASPRGPQSLGPGIRVETRKDVEEGRGKADHTVSIEEGE